MYVVLNIISIITSEMCKDSMNDEKDKLDARRRRREGDAEKDCVGIIVNCKQSVRATASRGRLALINITDAHLILKVNREDDKASRCLQALVFYAKTLAKFFN